MRKLLLSFVFTLLTAQTANAFADKSKTAHSVNLIEMFGADNVDAVINSSVGDIQCGEGINLPVENELDQTNPSGNGRAPAIVAGQSKRELFREAVEKDEFRAAYYKEGDIYSYSSESIKLVENMTLEMHVKSYEHVFNRKSKTEDHPF